MLLAELDWWGALPHADRPSLLAAADRAMAWILEYGGVDSDGFVEYRRHTDRGLVNQGWKDSFDGINHADGHLASPRECGWSQVVPRIRRAGPQTLKVKGTERAGPRDPSGRSRERM